ncbi:MAG: septal ring lytic transglycosylase RlpA family protein [Pseudomonadales bacterium]
MTSKWLVLFCVLLSGCVGNSSPTDAPGAKRPRVDGPPRGPHGNLAALPDAIPRLEPRSTRGNPASYEVFGETYRVMASATGYDRTGNASWYGRKFHGQQTSSGEPFDMYALSAAHRSLPIPCFVEVTNLDNQRRTVVRVNDRGPFHSDRILDLSYAAAVKLGFHEQGTARVRVRVVGPQRGTVPEPLIVAQPQPKLQSPTAVAAALPAPVPVAQQWFLQAGAFRQRDSALALRQRLVTLSPAPTFTVQVPADRLYRVRMGPFASRSEAERTQQTLAAARYPGAVILSAEKVISDGACLPQC